MSKRTVAPLTSVIVASSAWNGSKSVDASTIRSPARQLGACSSVISVAPTGAVDASLVHASRDSPCSSSRPPASTPIILSPKPWMSPPPSPVSVIVAFFVRLDDSVPICSVPCTTMYRDVSTRSSEGENVSEPLIVRLPSAGVSMSSSTFLSAGMTTSAPAAGSVPPHVAGSDQFAFTTGGGFPSPGSGSDTALHPASERNMTPETAA